MIYLVAFIGIVVAANWSIGQFGVVPVGFGLMAPAAVYFVGIAFTLRDLAHSSVGRRPLIGAILVGAIISAAMSPTLAIASGVAFLVSELADMAIYEPLRRKGWVAAVAASNIVGVIVDSGLFLWLAFGSFEFLLGQIVGKTWMTAAAIVVIWMLRRNRVAVPIG